MASWSPEDCRFEPSSAVDPVGRVFTREGRIFRAISPPYGPFVRELVSRAESAGWSELGLVRTGIADASIPGYELVIEHEPVPFVTLRGEWSFEGLRRAGECILRLNAALLREGLCLKDAHPWNVLFDATKPVFIDWGSVRPVGEFNWEFWFRQFRDDVLMPLYVRSTGRHRIARAMAREHVLGVGIELMDLPRFRRLPRTAWEIVESAPSRGIPAAIEDLAEYTRSLVLPEPPGEWAHYDQPPYAGLDQTTGLRLKDRVVLEILRQDPGKTVLDLGANAGLHSRVAADLGKKVVACDIEEACVERLFREAEADRADVLPLQLDFLWPIGDSGILNSTPPAFRRLACDTVIALAITHHLALRKGVSFDAIAAGLRALARRRVVVEFVPASDVHVATWSSLHRAEYTAERFIEAMSKHFGRVSVLDSDPSPRMILVFDDPVGGEVSPPVLPQGGRAGPGEVAVLTALRRELQGMQEQNAQLARQLALERDRGHALEEHLRAAESDRAARLGVIEEQGRRLGEVEGERNCLAELEQQLKDRLAAAEDDRANRLRVIEDQGRQIGELDARLQELQELASHFAALDAQLRDTHARFAASEIDRNDRGRVIEEMGHRMGEIEGERNRLVAVLGQTEERLRAAEADRAARLQAIESQGLRQVELETQLARFELELARLRAELSALECSRWMRFGRWLRQI